MTFTIFKKNNIMNRFNFTIFLSIITLLGCKSEQQKDDSKKDISIEKELAPEVIGEEVVYKSDTTNLKGYIAYDKNLTGKRPGILVVHEWWGHDEFAREKTEELAEMGYIGMAIDMYGSGKQANHPKEAMAFSGSVMKNFDTARQRFLAAMETLKTNELVNPNEISAIGFCFGGSVALSMANSGIDLDGVAAFHSGINLPVMPNESLDAKILVQNGADDVMITDEQVQIFKSKLDSLKADYKYIAYEGVKHSYTNKAADSIAKQYDLPLAYDEETAKKSWKIMGDFFDEIYQK